MDKTLKFELTSEDPAEINKLLNECLQALDRSHKDRAKVWEEIDRLNAANEATLAYLRELFQREA